MVKKGADEGLLTHGVSIASLARDVQSQASDEMLCRPRAQWLPV